jgi:hypothetical protein
MMTIEQLGPLSPDQHDPACLVSTPIETAYFPGIKLSFVLEDVGADEKPEEFSDAVRRFLQLSSSARELAAPYVHKNYTEACEASGESLAIAGPHAVWNHLRPMEIRVSRRPYGDEKVYVVIAAQCDWEPEHGLQIVYRGGDELARVSDQDGHLTHVDAFDLEEHEDRIA